jgi:phosphopantothenoylcysteine decarboxylase/phosphopantothenate--cysteine ligase
MAVSSPHQTLVLAVTGGFAAYKAAELARLFVKRGLRVIAVMTANARKFVQPLTFEVLTGNKVVTDMFDRALPPSSSMPHIDLARGTSLLLIAPASANIIAKINAGIADDILSTLCLSYKGPKIIAPAMNSEMWLNPVTQRNVKGLRDLGYRFVGPDDGGLACGDEGIGRLAAPGEIVEAALKELNGPS